MPISESKTLLSVSLPEEAEIASPQGKETRGIAFNIWSEPPQSRVISPTLGGFLLLLAAFLELDTGAPQRSAQGVKVVFLNSIPECISA